MNIVPFSPEHALRIDVQPAQIPDVMCHNIDDKQARVLAASGPAVTGMVGDEVVFCIGKFEVWKNRHIVWSLMSASAGKHMVGIVKAIKRLMVVHEGGGRFEIMVRAEFPQGCRLAEMMGFSFHHYEEKFLPDGGDAKIYVRFL